MNLEWFDVLIIYLSNMAYKEPAEEIKAGRVMRFSADNNRLCCARHFAKVVIPKMDKPG